MKIHFLLLSSTILLNTSCGTSEENSNFSGAFGGELTNGSASSSSSNTQVSASNSKDCSITATLNLASNRSNSQLPSESALIFDSANLWAIEAVTWSASPTFYRVNTSSGIFETSMTPVSMLGISGAAWDGEKFWISDESSIYTVAANGDSSKYIGAINNKGLSIFESQLWMILDSNQLGQYNLNTIKNELIIKITNMSMRGISQLNASTLILSIATNDGNYLSLYNIPNRKITHACFLYSSYKEQLPITIGNSFIWVRLNDTILKIDPNSIPAL